MTVIKAWTNEQYLKEAKLAFEIVKKNFATKGCLNIHSGLFFVFSFSERVDACTRDIVSKESSYLEMYLAE